MKNNAEYVKIIVDKIYNDLDLLKNRHVYEVDRVPGVPACSTLALRMRDNLDLLVEEYNKLLE